MKDSMSGRERMMAGMLRWAPWLSFFLVALPFPLLFLFLYFISSVAETAAIYFVAALLSLAIGSIAGLFVMIFLLVYRKRWYKRLRDKMAADGITADELPWFMSELTTAERQALKSMEGRNPLLADAYRETLASRLTATRVQASAKRDLLLVERRINRVSYIQGTDTTHLQEELRMDRVRLERVREEARERRAEAEARLHMIEAAASRGASWEETSFALQRLGAAREQLPLGLEVARIEQQAREDTEKHVREIDARSSIQTLPAQTQEEKKTLPAHNEPLEGSGKP
ncbi:MAG TPA: hypothetical protein VF708_13205 [Pyrinomonadaceae bacterium]